MSEREVVGLIYEYLVVNLNAGDRAEGVTPAEYTTKFLNEQAGEGWELVPLYTNGMTFRRLKK